MIKYEIEREKSIKKKKKLKSIELIRQIYDLQ
jgi:hypothetical protein